MTSETISALVGAGVGWVLAVVTGIVTTLWTEHRAGVRAAVTLRREMAAAHHTLITWEASLTIARARPETIKAMRFQRMSPGALETACQSGSLDEQPGGIGEWLRFILSSVRDANDAAQIVNESVTSENLSRLPGRILIAKAALWVGIEELDRVCARGRLPFRKLRSVLELNEALNATLGDWKASPRA